MKSNQPAIRKLTLITQQDLHVLLLLLFWGNAAFRIKGTRVWNLENVSGQCECVRCAGNCSAAQGCGVLDRVCVTWHAQAAYLVSVVGRKCVPFFPPPRPFLFSISSFGSFSSPYFILPPLCLSFQKQFCFSCFLYPSSVPFIFSLNVSPSPPALFFSISSFGSFSSPYFILPPLCLSFQKQFWFSCFLYPSSFPFFPLKCIPFPPRPFLFSVSSFGSFSSPYFILPALCLSFQNQFCFSRFLYPSSVPFIFPFRFSYLVCLPFFATLSVFHFHSSCPFLRPDNWNNHIFRPQLAVFDTCRSNLLDCRPISHKMHLNAYLFSASKISQQV